ncbi:MAG TPA: LegC family aminotransferase [Burkholderiales bacterium]|nr:LegC family aminotransferase [Burkholderiales bacterium]
MAERPVDPVVDAVLGAVRRVVPAQRGKVALHEPEFRGNEWQYVRECLDTGWVSSVGAFVERFEAMLVETTGAKHAVAVMNGTAALHACLLLAGVQRDDEVLIPALTFIATANAVSYAGAVPHFVDSTERTLGVDAAKLDAYLRETAELRDGTCRNRRTGAVIRGLVPMHTFGHPVDLDEIQAVCARWKLALIEDAAESLGSTYRGRHTGTFGRIAALSFNGNKPVTTGGGGAILTDDPALAKRAKHLTTTARVPHRWSFLHDEVGYNYRLPNLNAALGCAQLERFPDILARKRRLAARYIEAFRDVHGASIAAEPAETRSNYWLVTLLLARPDLALRDAVLDTLNANGLMARPVWTLMHRLPMYTACPRMDLACAEALEARIVNLPSSPFLAD